MVVVALFVGLVLQLFSIRLSPNVLVIQEVVPWGRGRFLYCRASAGRAGWFRGIALSCTRQCLLGISNIVSGSRQMMSSGGWGILCPSMPFLLNTYRAIGFGPLAGLPAPIESGLRSWSEESDMVATHRDWGLGDVTQIGLLCAIGLLCGAGVNF